MTAYILGQVLKLRNQFYTFHPKRFILLYHIQKIQKKNGKWLTIPLFGYEKYNNIRCAVGKFKIQEYNTTVTVWLDAKKGTCLKIVNSGYDSMGESFEYIEEYTAIYDVVNDENIKKPDLTGYTLVDDGSIEI